jgi:hypothetical protein
MQFQTAKEVRMAIIGGKYVSFQGMDAAQVATILRDASRLRDGGDLNIKLTGAEAEIFRALAAIDDPDASVFDKALQSASAGVE